jgi:hypothetical protein
MSFKFTYNYSIKFDSYSGNLQDHFVFDYNQNNQNPIKDLLCSPLYCIYLQSS